LLFPSLIGEGIESLAWNRKQGTKLKVFSGKEKRLNHVILRILREQTLIIYDIWQAVRAIRGFGRKRYKTVSRRVHALEQQGWIAKVGSRPTKPSGTSELYGITLRGKSALSLRENCLDAFLLTASDPQLLKLLEAFDK
jgi:DNA-binding PadR family transcriptional regulator